MTSDGHDRYTTRHPMHGRHIDIVPVDAGKGAGALVRIPVRDGRHKYAEDTADLVMRLLNDHARIIHQEEP